MKKRLILIVIMVFSLILLSTFIRGSGELHTLEYNEGSVSWKRNLGVDYPLQAFITIETDLEIGMNIYLHQINTGPSCYGPQVRLVQSLEAESWEGINFIWFPDVSHGNICNQTYVYRIRSSSQTGMGYYTMLLYGDASSNDDNTYSFHWEFWITLYIEDSTETVAEIGSYLSSLILVSVSIGIITIILLMRNKFPRIRI